MDRIKNNRFISALLVFAVVLSTLAGLTVSASAGSSGARPVGVSPDGKGAYELWVCNIQVTDANKGDVLGGGTVRFDPDTCTLTLGGGALERDPNAPYAMFGVIQARFDDACLTIRVTENTTIDVCGSDRYAIFCTTYSLDLVIEIADGKTLVCTGGVICNGHVTVKGGKLCVSDSKNVDTLLASGMDVTDATIYAVDEKAKDSSSGERPAAIFVKGDLTVKNSLIFGVTAGGLLKEKAGNAVPEARSALEPNPIPKPKVAERNAIIVTGKLQCDGPVFGSKYVYEYCDRDKVNGTVTRQGKEEGAFYVVEYPEANAEPVLTPAKTVCIGSGSFCSAYAKIPARTALEDEQYVTVELADGTSGSVRVLKREGGYVLRLWGELAKEEIEYEEGEEDWYSAANEQYAAETDGKFAVTEEPCVWQYDFASDCFYRETVATEEFSWFSLLRWKTVTCTYEVTSRHYLTVGAEGAVLDTVSPRAGTKFYRDTRHAEHGFDVQEHLENDTHALLCRYCGKRDFASCVYNGPGHRCVCGYYDPDVYGIADLWAGLKHGPLTWRYTVHVEMNSRLASRPKIEYSTDGGRTWHTTCTGSVEFLRNPDSFLYRVTDRNGNVFFGAWGQDRFRE